MAKKLGRPNREEAKKNGGRLDAAIGEAKGPGRRSRLHLLIGKERMERAIQKADLLPHEWMWSVAKLGFIRDVLVDGEELIWSLGPEARMEIAKAAAPFYAPKLSQIDVTQSFTEAELLGLILADPTILQTVIQLAQEAGCDVGAIVAGTATTVNGDSTRLPETGAQSVSNPDSG